MRRSGVSRSMPEVSGTPRVIASLRLGHAVYASPVVVGSTVVVATEGDVVYGLSTSGRQRWRTVVGQPATKDQLPCGNIDPLGITGTPVYDARTRLVHLVAELGGPPRHDLVAIDPTDGSVAWRQSVDLPGVQTEAMQQRGALAIARGSVWVPFGGLAGDCGQYLGRVVGVPLEGARTPTVFTVPTRRMGGIWTPPGPAVRADGRMFVSVGNGESAQGDAYDYSDSVLALEGSRRVDSFSPTTWAQDNAVDADLGSQGPALVDDRWVFIAGKSGTAYVLRQDDLGGIGGEVSQRDLCRSFGGTAVDGDVVYVPCTDGLRAVRIGADGRMDVLWHADAAITGSPVVGGGRVWSLDPGGTLYSLDPRTGATRSSTAVGATSRFATPAISGARLFVPTLAGLAIVATD